jgi:PhoPQ-activated pathogenicity-related protein
MARRHRWLVALSLVCTLFVDQRAFCQSAVVEPPAPPAAADRTARSTPLDKYVAAQDDSYAWRLESREEIDDATLLTLELTSQTWRREGEVDRTLWKHWLTIVVPHGATSDVALLYVAGGRNGGPPDRVSDRVAKVARATHSIVAQLGQVPNQPLVFRNDGRGRSEDNLVARSWTEALKTSDPTWMAQMPMAKAAVRAMDAVQAAIKQYGLGEVKRFVVSGGSKRGWTTWLAAAVDSRVVAIAPIVIDILNVQRSMQNHRAAYGFWAESLDDYSQQGLTLFVNSPFASILFGQVDPYSYRDRLTMPKCIINATGDQFFTPDSSKFYYDDLPGEKTLCYVPNADHSLAGSDAVDTLIAFHASIVQDLRRPKVAWERRADGAWMVGSDMPAKRALLWQAVNAKGRDFRVASIGKAFTSRELTPDADGRYAAIAPEVTQGWAAYFVQLEFDIGAAAPLRATSPVWITPDTLPYADGSSPPAAGK